MMAELSRFLQTLERIAEAKEETARQAGRIAGALDQIARSLGHTASSPLTAVAESAVASATALDVSSLRNSPAAAVTNPAAAGTFSQGETRWTAERRQTLKAMFEAGRSMMKDILPALNALPGPAVTQFQAHAMCKQKKWQKGVAAAAPMPADELPPAADDAPIGALVDQVEQGLPAPVPTAPAPPVAAVRRAERWALDEKLASTEIAFVNSVRRNYGLPPFT